MSDAGAGSGTMLQRVLCTTPASVFGSGAGQHCCAGCTPSVRALPPLLSQCTALWTTIAGIVQPYYALYARAAFFESRRLCTCCRPSSVRLHNHTDCSPPCPATTTAGRAIRGQGDGDLPRVQRQGPHAVPCMRGHRAAQRLAVEAFRGPGVGATGGAVSCRHWGTSTTSTGWVYKRGTR